MDGGTTGGLGAMGGTVAEGGFGNAGTEGAAGSTGGTIVPAADGGLGIDGIDGGFGAAGIPGIEAGGFKPADMTGGGGTAGDPPDTGTGFGGRLIIAVSRGLEAMGEPSRRAGRTILTVSFLGSAIVCSWSGLRSGLVAAGEDIHKLSPACQSCRAKLLREFIPRCLRSREPGSPR